MIASASCFDKSRAVSKSIAPALFTLTETGAGDCDSPLPLFGRAGSALNSPLWLCLLSRSVRQSTGAAQLMSIVKKQRRDVRLVFTWNRLERIDADAVRTRLNRSRSMAVRIRWIAVTLSHTADRPTITTTQWTTENVSAVRRR